MAKKTIIVTLQLEVEVLDDLEEIAETHGSLMEYFFYLHDDKGMPREVGEYRFITAKYK